MKIIVIGASGTIGRAVVDILAPDHQILAVGHSSGNMRVDLASRDSIENMFTAAGEFDALISAAGAASFGSLDELKDDDYEFAFRNKLMGQVNLVRLGRNRVSDRGCFTLTTGVLSQRPMPGSAVISMVNSALEGFVRAAALELRDHVRVNAVSPVFVKETMAKLGMDPSSGMSAADTARAYKASVEGGETGQVLDVKDYV
ncbi:MAG TPA: short chain dehydrogenase [Gammaproteobacteria bacterium]|nr:short chain dehydrogenase [Gammaproteobacteria bacterium]